MATWQEVMIPIVRALINDTSSTPVYDDDRIEMGIVTAGLIVSNEFEFSIDYTFDFITPDISPDPVSEEDSLFVALVSLKAACIFTINSYQSGISTGIRVRSGDDEVDTTRGFGGYKDIIMLGPCSAYTKLLDTSLVNSAMSRGGRAIIGSGFSHPDLSAPQHWTPEIFWNTLRYRW